MLDENAVQIANLLSEFLHEHGLDRRGHHDKGKGSDQTDVSLGNRCPTQWTRR